MYNVYWVCLMYVFVQIAQNMKVIIYIHISQANMLGELITLSGNGKKENTNAFIKTWSFGWE